eukprot:1159120-Pelagomonas_calceolata.AAC.2
MIRVLLRLLQQHVASLSSCSFGVAAAIAQQRVTNRARAHAPWWSIAAIITATCDQLELMLFGRTLYGLGIGFAMHAAPACE